MNDERLTANKCCKEMNDTGITDPNSQAGINFCVDKCPHPYCIVVEKVKTGKPLENWYEARKLNKQGMSIRDIARKLKIHAKTVAGYLKDECLD